MRTYITILSIPRCIVTIVDFGQLFESLSCDAKEVVGNGEAHNFDPRNEHNQHLTKLQNRAFHREQ